MQTHAINIHTLYIHKPIHIPMALSFSLMYFSLNNKESKTDFIDSFVAATGFDFE